jgi:hypothetical protein
VQDRLQMLLAIHNEFIRAADLPEGSRPYSVQSHLGELETQIMKLIKENPPGDRFAPPAPNLVDDIPF